MARMRAMKVRFFFHNLGFHDVFRTQQRRYGISCASGLANTYEVRLQFSVPFERKQLSRAAETALDFVHAGLAKFPQGRRDLESNPVPL